jgi:UDP-N-acetylglucosamine:LPS N-acetylglucosamine transferase
MSVGEHKPEILFATIAAGGGHVAGAHAMAEAIEHHYAGRFELRVSDYMKEAGAKKVTDLDHLHKDVWRFMLRYPILARGSQRLMDAFPRATVAAQRRLVRGFARAAAADLGEDPPLLIFSNHGLMTAGLAEAKRIGGLEVPVLSFANELVGICSYWADPRADRIVVPSGEARRDLLSFGVPESKLSFVGFGYPVRQAFLNAPPKTEARARLGLEDRFTCLVSSGGEGVERNQREMVRVLLGSDVPLQVVVIAGRNERLKAELRALGTGKNVLRIEGYVENLAEYLAASDVFVGKAGPASVYEAIVVGRPALVTGYAGLNEVGVARLVEERGLGRYVWTPGELLEDVRRYALNPALLENVARRCRELDPAAATERLAHYVVRYAKFGEDGT